MLYLNLVYKYNYTDCKEWFMNGNTTSGVYTINPDEGTPFEVSYGPSRALSHGGSNYISFNFAYSKLL